jgi:hypothetical protein
LVKQHLELVGKRANRIPTPDELPNPWGLTLKVHHTREEKQRCSWFYGGGSLWKTKYQEFLRRYYSAFVRKGSKRVYEFWDAYDNEEIMVLDEYNKAYMDYADLNGLADTDCDLRIPATGGSATRHVTFKMLFVFSNNSIVR